jgi:uncharacterized protein (DUF58 family)
VRTVRARPFREYFKNESEGEWQYTDDIRFDWNRFFYRNRQRFNRQSFVLLTLVVFGISAWTTRSGRVMLLTEALFLVLLYFRALKSAEGLELVRRIPAAGYDFKPVRVEYEIRNASAFTAHDLVIRDFFSGTVEPVIQTVSPRPVPAFRVGRAGREVRCDAGMGTHAWGPLTTVVSDPLGIFEVVVSDDQSVKMQVLPSPVTLEGFDLPDSVDSGRQGSLESRLKGHSSNFFGVREYVPGDPLKSIHWKLSARHRQLIVNEFETQVPIDLTVSLDLDGRNHIGRIGDNSWKMVKDIAVGLVQNLTPEVSRMQVLSQKLHLEFGQGNAHLLAAVEAISRLEPVRPDSPAGILERFAESIPFGSSLIHVMPVYQNDRSRLLRTFEYLVGRSVQCTVILVEAQTFLADLPIELTAGIRELDRQAHEIRDRLCAGLHSLGIDTRVIRRGETLQRVLVPGGPR